MVGVGGRCIGEVGLLDWLDPRDRRMAREMYELRDCAPEDVDEDAEDLDFRLVLDPFFASLSLVAGGRTWCVETEVEVGNAWSWEPADARD